MSGLGEDVRACGPLLWNCLGIELWRGGERNDARHCFAEAHALDSKYMPALNNLAIAAFEAGETDEAIVQLRQLADFSPHYRVLLQNLKIVSLHKTLHSTPAGVGNAKPPRVEVLTDLLALEWSEQPLLICYHMMRVGGATMESIMWWQYRDNYFRIGEEEEVFRKLYAAPHAQRAYIELAYVHRPAAFACVDPNARYFSWLRNPVESYVSKYYWQQDNPALGVTPTMTMDELFDLWEERDNYGRNARFFAHVIEDGYFFDQELKISDDELLARARRALDERFFFVGLTENFNETLLLLARKLGWTQLPRWERMNATGRPPTSTLPKPTLDRLRVRIQVELEIYRICRERFERELDTLTPADFRVLESYSDFCTQPGKLMEAFPLREAFR